MTTGSQGPTPSVPSTNFLTPLSDSGLLWDAAGPGWRQMRQGEHPPVPLPSGLLLEDGDSLLPRTNTHTPLPIYLLSVYV